MSFPNQKVSSNPNESVVSVLLEASGEKLALKATSKLGFEDLDVGGIVAVGILVYSLGFKPSNFTILNSYLGVNIGITEEIKLI
ncbi:hypothetical protein G9A89_001058 [Geosiphon pyriformis]|nr:hypothetical protein G9A89_001058 [Geosiphon pyriformis]